VSGCELQTEKVDIHSLERQGDDWALCVYQTPSILKVVDLEVAQVLQKALDEGRSVELSWEPGTGLVRGCEGRSLNG
jgi:hypothetical protein